MATDSQSRFQFQIQVQALALSLAERADKRVNELKEMLCQDHLRRPQQQPHKMKLLYRMDHG